MPKHESFLLRVDPAILAAVKRWAADELRSANGQIEFLLRRALLEAHRLPAESQTQVRPAEPAPDRESSDCAK